jgi:hypothetical protein
MARSTRRKASQSTHTAHLKTTSNRKPKIKAPTSQRAVAKKGDKLPAKTPRGNSRTLHGELHPFRGPEVADNFRILAEEKVLKARELLEVSRNSFQSIIESWHQTFGAVGRSAAALNRKMIHTAERNMETSLDLALGLARARSFREAMELQAAFWGNVAGGHTTSPKSRISTRKR